MKRMSALCLLLFSFLTLTFAQTNNSTPELTGDYLGQNPPGETAEIFAPGIVSAGMMARDMAITPDGNEIYFGRAVGNYLYSTIMMVKRVKGRWMNPEVAPFADSPEYNTVEPCISPDGSKFYFSSNRPKKAAEKKSDYDIYVMERTGDTWSEPRNLGPSVNSDGDEYFPSITNDGTIYFCRQGKDRVDVIYRCRLSGDKYSEAEKLPEQVNTGQTRFNAFIAPDEGYIIVCVFGRKDSKGSTDYYISFRDEKDNWSEAVNMGDKINTASGNEYSPYVTRDGKYFFFMSARPSENFFKEGEKLTAAKLDKIHNSAGNGNASIYWFDAGFIKGLKEKK